MRILGGILALTMLLAACSNDGPSSLDGSGTAPSKQTPAGEPRSFKTDVIPLLTVTGSCAQAACHGDSAGSAGVGIYLPLADSDGIYNDLITTTSTRAPGARFVVPNDASKSFLYAVMKGDFTGFTSVCPSKDCGQPMPPPPSPSLSAADLEQVRLWISEGAKNN